jgi:hypothetical protein
MKLLKLWREKCNTSILNIFYQICSQSPHSWFVYCTIKLLVKIIVLFHRQHWVVVNLMIRLYAAICRVRFVFRPMRITADITISLHFVYGEIWIATTLHVLIRLRSHKAVFHFVLSYRNVPVSMHAQLEDGFSNIRNSGWFVYQNKKFVASQLFGVLLKYEPMNIH